MERMTFRLSLPTVNKWEKDVPSTQLNAEVDLVVDLLVEEYGGCKVWRSVNKVVSGRTKKLVLVPILILEVRGRGNQDQKVFQLARRMKNELCLATVMVERFTLANAVQV